MFLNKKKIVSFLTLILLAMPVFSQLDHFQRFFKCGMPGLRDYSCFDYDTLQATNPRKLQNSANYNTSKIPRKFMTRMMFMRTSAYLVIKNNEVLFEQYWGGYNENSQMNSFSVAKSIVSLLIGIAIKEKKIESINQKISDFLPQIKSTDYSPRIIDFLSMSSGSNWNEDFANPMSDIAIAYYGSNIDSLLRQMNIVNEPGKKWKYQCGNTIILGLMLEKATGTPLAQYAQEKLWTPIGATKPAFWAKDKPNGITKAFCCFYATARDYAKLGLLVLNKGSYNGTQIIDKQYIEKITSPSNWLKFRKKTVDFYALHIWRAKYNNKMIPYFQGMFGQYIFIFPEENAVVVRFGEMLNELIILPEPPDVKLYLKVAKTILE